MNVQAKTKAMASDKRRPEIIGMCHSQREREVKRFIGASFALLLPSRNVPTAITGSFLKLTSQEGLW
jgi:hypothetical protein